MTATNDMKNRTVIFVTGMSGAGKSTALHVLEDYGFEAVDNLPVSLLGNLVLSGATADDNSRPVAIGVDVRARDFNAGHLIGEIDRLREAPGLDVTLLFLDCADTELENRFKTTRRRHPLASDRKVMDGIAQERILVLSLKKAANTVIDTTEKSVADLRKLMDTRFSDVHDVGLALFVTSFSYAHGVPREADLVFDVRFLKNPHYVEALHPLSGQDAAVGAYIETDPGFADFLGNLKSLLEPLLPRYVEEGKSYLTIAIGCTGGRHRSVFIAEQLSHWLEKLGKTVHIMHRDLERQQERGLGKDG